MESLYTEGFSEVVGATAPAGVYALLFGEEVVYVGQSTNIYQRLTSHYNAGVRGYRGKGRTFTSPNDIRAIPIPFDSMWIKICPKAALDREEIALIEQYRPRYNRAGNDEYAASRPQVNIIELSRRAKIDWAKHYAGPPMRRRKVA